MSIFCPISCPISARFFLSDFLSFCPIFCLIFLFDFMSDFYPIFYGRFFWPICCHTFWVISRQKRSNMCRHVLSLLSCTVNVLEFLLLWQYRIHVWVWYSSSHQWLRTWRWDSKDQHRGPNFCTFLQLVFLLSILDPRAAHFQSYYCLCLMIYYPCVHSFGPNFIIFRKHGNIPEGLNILALIEWLWLHWGVPRWNTVNRPLPSTKNPRFQNEARCTTFLVKMKFYLHENEK